MIANHDGSAAAEELPPGPAQIGAVRSASWTQLGIDPNRAGIAALVTLAIALAVAFGLGAILKRFMTVDTITWVVIGGVIAPAAMIARWLVMGSVGGRAITWVGEEGFAIGRVADGKATIRTFLFRDVGRMDLDKQPLAHAHYGHVAITLRVDDRRGKRLTSIHGKVRAQVANASDSTTLAEWEKVEEVLRAAPTDSASHFVRAITDVWTARR